MLSSEKAPPFLDQYLTTKLEAEQYLKEECPNIKPILLRPGFIWDAQHRWWSVPLSYGVDMAWQVGEWQKSMPYSRFTDFLYPAKSVKLTTVAHFAIQGAIGQLPSDEPIIRN